MKSSTCVIYWMNSAINRQLGNQYDFAGVLQNQPGWCLFLCEEIPSDVIVGRIGNDDDIQTVIDLLGI